MRSGSTSSSEASASARAELAAQTSQPLLETTVGERLREQAARFGDRAALSWAGDGGRLESLTYAELLAAAEASAASLQQHARPGDRVAVWAGNSPQWLIVELASALAGTVLAPFNTAWTDEEVLHALALTSPRVLYAGPDNRGLALNGRAAGLAGSIGGCPTADLASVATRPPDGAGNEFEAPPVAPDDPFLIQFTSGTTGRAKGATRPAAAGCRRCSTPSWRSPAPTRRWPR